MDFSSSQPIIVCGLGFGDEGKGTIVDALARKIRSSLVVRHNGGAQAGHNVVTQNGIWHCFAQFGSGSLGQHSHSHLSEHMLIDLESLFVERDVLKQKIGFDPITLLTIDPNCLLITPIQRILGRMKEVARGDSRYGSCGMGVGQTIFDDEAGLSIRVRDILNDAIGKQKLVALVDAKLAEANAIMNSSSSIELEKLNNLLQDHADPDVIFHTLQLKLSQMRIEETHSVLRDTDRTLIFEGAQGALLDRTRGFVPHVTKSDTTSKNAIDLLAKAERNETPFTLGVLRAYGHRHGAGPFVTEDVSVRERFMDQYNPENPWQGAFRLGWIDLPALRYSIRMNGHVDALALTGLDRLSGLDRIRICIAYRTQDGQTLKNIPDTLSARKRTELIGTCIPQYMEWPGWKEDLSRIRSANQLPHNAKIFLRFLEHQLNTPIKIVSVGQTAEQKLYR